MNATTSTTTTTRLLALSYSGTPRQVILTVLGVLVLIIFIAAVLNLAWSFLHRIYVLFFGRLIIAEPVTKGGKNKGIVSINDDDDTDTIDCSATRSLEEGQCGRDPAEEEEVINSVTLAASSLCRGHLEDSEEVSV
jgi:hypothetical protein